MIFFGCDKSSDEKNKKSPLKFALFCVLYYNGI